MYTVYKIIVILLLSISFFSCSKEGDGLGCDCRDEWYYYYNDEKIFLDDRSPFRNDWLFVGFETKATNDTVQETNTWILWQNDRLLWFTDLLIHIYLIHEHEM